jgi:hypothetical protein
LSPTERQRLLEWTRRPKTAQALALRARIVLLCAEGRSNTEVGRRAQVTLATEEVATAFPFSVLHNNL